MSTPGIRDTHKRLASHFYCIHESEVTREQRHDTKLVTFSCVTEPETVNESFSDRFVKAMGDRPISEPAATEVQGLLEMLRFSVEKSGESITVLDPSRTYSWVTEVGPDIPMGIYDHFKGGVYLATGVAHWASGDMEYTVEYVSLLGPHAGKKCNRFAWQWAEVVQWPDGKYRSRFVYRGRGENVPPPPWKVTPA
jgi:hypothetical protein